MLPIGDTLDQLGDKAKFHEIASAAGWPVPETRIVREPSDLARVAAEISLPLVVKPPRRTPAWRDASGDRKVIRFDDRGAFLREAPGLLEVAGELVIQAWVAGSPSASRELIALYDAEG